MPSYRFCRPDDVPLLVRAVNECFLPHFAGQEASAPAPAAPAAFAEPMTIARFRREMKEVDLWPSSCLVALSGDDPLAVLTGTKRPEGTLVTRLAVRPGDERQGHCRHLVTSLSQKLAVLGPPLLLAEVPDALPGAVAFFEALGWRRETTFTDWLGGAGGEGLAGQPPPAGLVGEATAAGLAAAGVLTAAEGAAWERQAATLLARGDELRGLAIAGPDRVEAWLLYAPAAGEGLEEPPGESGSEVAIHGWGVADPGRADALMRVLVQELARRTAGRPLRLLRLASDELPEDLLTGLGLRPAERTHRFTAEARPL